METQTIGDVALAAIADLSGTVLALGGAMIGVGLVYVGYKWFTKMTGSR